MENGEYCVRLHSMRLRAHTHAISLIRVLLHTLSNKHFILFISNDKYKSTPTKQHYFEYLKKMCSVLNFLSLSDIKKDKENIENQDNLIFYMEMPQENESRNQNGSNTRSKRNVKDMDTELRMVLDKLPVPPPSSPATAAAATTTTFLPLSDAAELLKKTNLSIQPVQSSSSTSGSSSSSSSSSASSSSASDSALLETPESYEPTRVHVILSEAAENWESIGINEFLATYSRQSSFIGSGSYGSVFLVCSRERGFNVAMKVMHGVSPFRGYLMDAQQNAKDEVRALIRLRHCYGYEFCNGRFPSLIDYFVLPKNLAHNDEVYGCEFIDNRKYGGKRIDFVSRMFNRNPLEDRLFCIATKYERGTPFTNFVFHEMSIEKNAVEKVWNRPQTPLHRCALMWEMYLKRRAEDHFTSLSLARSLCCVLSTLYYVHRANLVHCDLSINNLYIPDGKKHPMILDFGLAVSTTSTGTRSESAEGDRKGDNRWSGVFPLPSLPIHCHVDRKLAQTHAHVMKHSHVRDILRATDIAQVAESFLYIANEIRKKYNTRFIKWTPKVSVAIRTISLYCAKDVSPYGSRAALHCANMIAKAIEKDEKKIK